MPRLLLHIGSPKAGSSAIQASLASHQGRAMSTWPWSGRRWLCLPPNPDGRPYPSGFIAGAYLPIERLPRYLQLRQRADPSRFQRDVARYQALIRRRLQPRWRPAPAGAILSCEYLWRLSADAIRRLRDDVASLGVEQVRVIAYVREPASLYSSALQQWARLSTDLSRFDPGQWRYELRQRLEAWAEVFAADLVVRPFEREQLHAGCVVQDLQRQATTWLGQESWSLQLKAAEPINSSASAEAVFAMQELMARQLTPGQVLSRRCSRELGRLWDQLQALDPSGAGSRLRLRPEVEAAIRHRHQSDLDWLAHAHGVCFRQPPPLAQADAGAAPVADGGRWSLDQLVQPPRDAGLLKLFQAQLATVALPD